ncbi:hypothetical protein DFH09DRAFT_1081711 [Mycena vulgaris]|nr:hypothetical protein DFH09DRAFT_1081711 [Mycena vulgaris]
MAEKQHFGHLTAGRKYDLKRSALGFMAGPVLSIKPELDAILYMLPFKFTVPRELADAVRVTDKRNWNAKERWPWSGWRETVFMLGSVPILNLQVVMPRAWPGRFIGLPIMAEVVRDC